MSRATSTRLVCTRGMTDYARCTPPASFFRPGTPARLQPGVRRVALNRKAGGTTHRTPMLTCSRAAASAAFLPPSFELALAVHPRESLVYRVVYSCDTPVAYARRLCSDKFPRTPRSDGSRLLHGGGRDRLRSAIESELGQLAAILLDPALPLLLVRLGRHAPLPVRLKKHSLSNE